MSEIIREKISTGYGILFFIIIIFHGVRLSPLRPLFGLLYQTRMLDDCGAIGGMRIGRRNRSTQRKYVPVPRPPQIPHDLTRAQTRAATVGSRRLTT
jgi:hypothetical protein